MKKKVILFIPTVCLMLWGIHIQAAPIRNLPDTRGGAGRGLGLEDAGPTGEGLHMMDQLGRIDIDDEYFFEFSLEDHGELGQRSSTYRVDLYVTGGGGIRRSILGFDRGTAFDQGTKFDQRLAFDEGRKFDQGAKFDKGAGFDAVRGFDRESLLRIREGRERDSVRFRPDEGFPVDKPEQETALLETRPRGREQVGPGTGDRRSELLSPGKGPSRQDLLRGDELNLNAVRPVERGFLIKVGMFAVALLALLAGTLKGLIPFKFYFFLTILVLILWNPMESLFISIIIGLSALLAPIFG